MSPRRTSPPYGTAGSARSPAGVLIDTDVFIDHLRGARRLVPPAARGCYSSITRCELFAGRQIDEGVVRTLLGPFSELGVDREIAERAGRIRRETGVRLADAVIAATALEFGLSVRTRNVAGFGRVPGLEVDAGE